MTDRKHVLFDENYDGPQWVVTYLLEYDEIDDNIESDNTTEIILDAENFDTAVRYAQQYLRKMQSDETTSEKWSRAEILSIELY